MTNNNSATTTVTTKISAIVLMVLVLILLFVLENESKFSVILKLMYQSQKDDRMYFKSHLISESLFFIDVLQSSSASFVNADLTEKGR